VKIHQIVLPAGALLLVLAASAQAQTNIVVRSDSDCPSAQAVSQALWAIRPDDEWPPLVASIQSASDRIEVVLGVDADNKREIAPTGSCADRATGAALVIAIWSGKLPSHATGAPTLTVATPMQSLTAAGRSDSVTEFGLSGFSSVVGGYAPGIQAEVGRFRHERGWGVRAVAAYQGARSIAVDAGDTRYERAQLGVLLVLRWTAARLFASGDLGLLGTMTWAHGEGYSRNASAHGQNVGLGLDGRMGIRLGKFRLWVSLQGCRWASKETVRVEPLLTGAPTTAALPAWDAHLGLGASMAFQ
jgi:hypothetical protein